MGESAEYHTFSHIAKVKLHFRRIVRESLDGKEKRHYLSQ